MTWSIMELSLVGQWATHSQPGFQARSCTPGPSSDNSLTWEGRSSLKSPGALAPVRATPPQPPQERRGYHPLRIRFPPNSQPKPMRGACCQTLNDSQNCVGELYRELKECKNISLTLLFQEL